MLRGREDWRIGGGQRFEMERLPAVPRERHDTKTALGESIRVDAHHDRIHHCAVPLCALYFEITVTSAPRTLPNLRGSSTVRTRRVTLQPAAIRQLTNNLRLQLDQNIEQAAPYFGSSSSRLDSAHGVSPPPPLHRVILPHKIIKPSRGPSPVSHPSASYQLPCALGWVSLSHVHLGVSLIPKAKKTSTLRLRNANPKTQSCGALPPPSVGTAPSEAELAKCEFPISRSPGPRECLSVRGPPGDSLVRGATPLRAAVHSMSVSFGTAGALLHGMALVVALGDFWGVTRDVVRGAWWWFARRVALARVLSCEFSFRDLGVVVAAAASLHVLWRV